LGLHPVKLSDVIFDIILREVNILVG
jgi:hypothetical protein